MKKFDYRLMSIGGREGTYGALIRPKCICQSLYKKMCNESCMWCDVSLCEVL